MKNSTFFEMRCVAIRSNVLVDFFFGRYALFSKKKTKTFVGVFFLRFETFRY